MAGGDHRRGGGLGAGAAAWAGAQRINQPLAAPTVQARGTDGRHRGRGQPGPTLAGQGPGGGRHSRARATPAQSGPESPVPIASLTKMTTALVVLRDHPVPAGTSGPAITITAADVAEYDNELHNDQSTVPIQTGEVL